jgi:hypothetical protein
MNRTLSKYIGKFYFKKWIIGIFRDDIRDIIRSKTFNPDIKWLMKESVDKFYADPFLITSKDENLRVICEEYPFEDDYGKISLMTLDKKFNLVNYKILLDTGSHLSYPFLFTENNRIYVFPESKKSGKVICYEYDKENESLEFRKEILTLSLVDSSILKYDNKYWLFGTQNENEKNYKLFLFFSENLMGPYKPHPCNPVKSGLDGTRSAGDFIEVDGSIYRPSQNCTYDYGESMTVNKITLLNETAFAEEPYMDIRINKKNKCNNGMHTIHTINVINDNVVVDGMHWTFSPVSQFKKLAGSLFNSHPKKTSE